MLKIVALLITLAAVYSQEPITSMFKKIVEDAGIDENALRGRCSKFHTVTTVSKMLLRRKYLMSTTNETIFCAISDKGDLSTRLNYLSYLNNDSSIIRDKELRLIVDYGMFAVIKYPAEAPENDLRSSEIFIEAMLKVSNNNNTVLTVTCDVSSPFQGFKPIYEFLIKKSKTSCSVSAVNIFTTTGKITPSVSEFEEYAVQIGAASPGSIRRLDLTKCKDFYKEEKKVSFLTKILNYIF
ncbi:hypothetical protein CHUAL_006221 [Chamberlinius hualienensis]